MQNITSLILTFLVPFTFQSLTILLFKRSILMKIAPLAMFIVPISGIWEVVSNSPELFTQTLISWLDILIPLLLGDILGWIMGFHFRKIVDKEYKEMITKYEEEYERDHDQTE